MSIPTVRPLNGKFKSGRRGDFQYNGQRVEGTEQFTRMVQETPEGREVKLQIFRNGASQIVTAKIGSKSPAT